MAKGEIIVEGAKCFCSNSVEKNSKATAVPIAVKSQTENLGKNKYFAQEKPIATNLDKTAESFGGGNGFGECFTTDKKKLPCKAKCSIKYKDYYENVDFDKSMKVLLDISTGTCPGYGKTGTITFATTGQKKAVNTIDIKDADPFMVENTSAQWETYNPTKDDSVTEINIIAPFAEKPTGKYYFIERAVNSGFFPLSKLIIETKLHLKAISKGDPSKITWAIFKGEGVTDKVKTFVGIGANIEFTLDKLFKDFDEGVYRIEAYARKAGSEKCFILIEYIKDYVEGITAPGKKLVKNTPIPLTLKFKASSFAEKLKILNPPTTGTETLPNAHWRVTQENRAPLQNIVIYNSQMNPDSNLVKVEIQTGLLGVFIFRNPGIYEIEAYTAPDDPSPVKTTLTVVESLEINTVKGTSSQLLRYNESLKVEVSKFNVDFLPTNTTKMQWHLQKDGVRLTVFENAAISKEKSISKPINEILYYDASGGNNYFGKYVIEAYAKLNNKPLFNGADSFFFEVIRNAADKITLPESIPKGAKVKYEVAARIMPLTGDEKINLELPTGVTDNNDQTLTFDTEGTFEIAAYLTGDETLQTKVKAKIKVANPELKRALWAYGTGYKRTETGYNEETHAFVEIAGLENQSITIKVWVRGAGGSFYSEPAKYMLEEKKIALNDRGIGSFKITTDDKYKEKIKKVLPATSKIPNPNINLTFTIEPPTGNQGAIILPATMAIKNGKPVVGTKFIEVLAPNEELAIISEKKINPIFFSTEDGKGVQQTLTHHSKTHKIWVHTVNMQEEELKVDVMNLTHSDCMEEKDGIITALQSIQEYKEKVGSDGLLELPFTAEEKHLTDAEANPVRFSIQVSRKVKDPNDFRNDYYIFEDDQLVTMPYPNASLVRSPDMKTIGIKAKKQDDTPFTKEEKIALRKQLICFKNTALIVQKGILTQEAIENCTVPVVVDLEMADLIKGKNCYCNKDLTEEEVKAIIKIIKGSETIFGHADCTIKDKSIASFTLALNTTFIKYNINSCIQKITFLAQAFHESDNFNTAEEYSSNHNSSKSFYKGRGLIQMTGVKGSGSSLYNEPGPYKTYADYVGNKEIINKPELIAQELTYAVDSAAWVWSKNKKSPKLAVLGKFTEAEKSSVKWKAEYFKDGLNMTLNELAIVMENVDEDKYFYFQSKTLNGYEVIHKLERDPNGWSDRKTTFSKLKTWFKYDKNVCKSGAIIPLLSGRAPWLIIAMQEFEKYKGLREIDSPLKEKVHEYFKVSSTGSQKANGTLWNHTDAWCGAFLVWCFEQTKEFKKINTAYSAKAFGWKSDKWNKGEDSEPFVGALIIFDFSHVALIVGENMDGTAYVYLGGNQGNGEKRSGYQKIILGSVPKNDKSIVGITKPKKYIIREEDKKLPKYDVNAENSKESSR